MIRLILIAIFLFSFLILSIPILFVEWIIGKFSPSAKDKSCKAIVDWGFRCVIFIAGTKVIVRGKENIPDDTGARIHHRDASHGGYDSVLFPRV